MLQPWTFLIATHAIAATLALVFGAFQLVRRVKGDPIHRLTGRIWVGLMLYVSVFSFGFGGYRDGIDVFLRVLAVWTIFSVLFAIYQARKKNIALHRAFMIGTYLGLWGAFIAVLAVHTRRVPSWFSAHPLEMSLVALGILTFACVVLSIIMHTHSNSKK